MVVPSSVAVNENTLSTFIFCTSFFYLVSVFFLRWHHAESFIYIYLFFGRLYLSLLLTLLTNESLERLFVEHLGREIAQYLQSTDRQYHPSVGYALSILVGISLRIEVF